MSQKYKHSAKTLADWTTLNPIIVANEIVIELGTPKKFKVGNGTDHYLSLPYEIDISNLSGTNTGDETAATIVTKIGNGTVIGAEYLPSYVDDVLEVANYAALPGTGETGKIYVTIDTGFEYRWSGSVYVHINVTDISGKEDKVTGKGLSTNDYDTTTKGWIDAVRNSLYHIAGRMPLNYFQSGTPGSPTPNQIWYNTTTKDIHVWASVEGWSYLIITPAVGMFYVFGGICYIWNGTDLVDTDITGKVDKVTGMGLSTNDYDTVTKDWIGAVKNSLYHIAGRMPLNYFQSGTPGSPTPNQIWYNTTTKNIHVWASVEGWSYLIITPAVGMFYVFGGICYIWNGTDLVDITLGDSFEEAVY